MPDLANGAQQSKDQGSAEKPCPLPLKPWQLGQAEAKHLDLHAAKLNIHDALQNDRTGTPYQARSCASKIECVFTTVGHPPAKHAKPDSWHCQQEILRMNQRDAGKTAHSRGCSHGPANSSPLGKQTRDHGAIGTRQNERQMSNLHRVQIPLHQQQQRRPQKQTQPSPRESA